MAVLTERIRELFGDWDAEDLSVLAETAATMAREKAEPQEEPVLLPLNAG